MSDNSKKKLSVHATKNTVKPEDVALISRRVTRDETVEVVKYHVHDYSTEKLGILGSHQLLEITIKVRQEIVSFTNKLTYFHLKG